MDKGLFSGLFDFDGDGSLNMAERASEFQFFCDVIPDGKDPCAEEDRFESDPDD